jgi:LmbE family N-acetylglucosaminyl deacetylase
MERVLAFGCHPDDVEIMCAGTLAALADAGCEIHIATMTGGEVGSATLSSQQIREKRLGEARDAAAVIGATYHWAGGRDLEVTYNDEYRRRTVHIVRTVRPTIVLTHLPYDYMLDHEETSKLVRTAAFIATVPLYDCGTPVAPLESVPYLYYWNAVDLTDIFGRPTPMTFGIDVADKLSIKREILARHESQRDWLKYINGWDAYLGNMEDYTARQGERVGVPYGECYVQHVVAPHPADNILADLLPDRLAPVR